MEQIEQIYPNNREAKNGFQSSMAFLHFIDRNQLLQALVYTCILRLLYNNQILLYLLILAQSTTIERK